MKVGDELTPLVKEPVTRVQLVQYAGASGDFNPIHWDPERGSEMGLGGVIAHGMLSMGFLGQYATSLAGPENSPPAEGALRRDGAARRRAHVQGRRARGRRDASDDRHLGGERAGRQGDNRRGGGGDRMRFEGKVALVTGGARGIGAATAARFAEEGAKVAVTDLDFDDEGSALQIRCDVTKRDEVEAAVAQTVDELGGLDILVTCAGVIRDNLLFKMSDDDFDTVISTHLRGTFLAAQAAQAHMVAQKSGRMVLVSSTSALGNRGQTNYSAAKAGIQGMAKTFAIELGPFGVTVNCVAPGFIVTRMTRADGRAGRHGLRGLPEGRGGGDPRPARRPAGGRGRDDRVLLLGGGRIRLRPGDLRPRWAIRGRGRREEDQ